MFLMGNLITCTVEILEGEHEQEEEDDDEEGEEGKHTFNKIFLSGLSHIAHVCCSIYIEVTPYLTWKVCTAGYEKEEDEGEEGETAQKACVRM